MVVNIDLGAGFVLRRERPSVGENAPLSGLAGVRPGSSPVAMWGGL